MPRILSFVIFLCYFLNLSLLSDAANKSPSQGDNENDDPLQRVANEETLRVIKAEVRFLLEKEVPPKLKIDKWTLVQKMKTVMSKACPEAETPLFLLNAMLRLFRQMYIHTRDYNPAGDRFQESAQYKRIADALNTCGSEAKVFNFTYVDAPTVPSDCYTINASDTSNASRMLSFCTCKRKLDTVELTYTKNASNPDEKFVMHENEFTLTGELSYFLPSGDGTKRRDLPTETLWKIFNFAHFYCAKYFKLTPSDHSTMLTLFDALLNKEIRYRWENPGNRSNEVWANLFSSFDLDRFTLAVDACLAGAKLVSDYPKWLVRPTNENFNFDD